MFQIVKSHSDSIAFPSLPNHHHKQHTRVSAAAVEKVNVIYNRVEIKKENQEEKKSKSPTSHAKPLSQSVGYVEKSCPSCRVHIKPYNHPTSISLSSVVVAYNIYIGKEKVTSYNARAKFSTRDSTRPNVASER